MSQYAQSLKTKTYSLAGTQLHSFERIVVSDNVDLPDSVMEDENTRITYKAKRSVERSRFTVSLPWALLLIVLTVGIISGILLSKSQQGKALKEEFAQLQNQYTVSEKERLLLENELESAKDSNFICYYASQNLGMKLALHEETIQVVVAQSEGYQQFARFYGNAAINSH